MADVSQNDFNFYQSLLFEKSGMALTEDKSYLLLTRLTHVASSLGYDSFDSFTADLRKTSSPALIQSVIDAMTTHETSFFRDIKPFQMLKELLPDLVAKREARKTLRIWSAACSTGQEAYSMAILLEEFFATRPGWNVQIIGTDISKETVSLAQKGEFNQFEIQRGLSIQQMIKHFTQAGTNWKIKDNLRQMASFQHANLLENLTIFGTFDIVFCRNVLIYFNNDTKTKVLKNIFQKIAPDGYLFLGACETIASLSVPFEPFPGHHGIMRPKTA